MKLKHSGRSSGKEHRLSWKTQGALYEQKKNFYEERDYRSCKPRGAKGERVEWEGGVKQYQVGSGQVEGFTKDETGRGPRTSGEKGVPKKKLCSRWKPFTGKEIQRLKLR